MPLLSIALSILTLSVVVALVVSADPSDPNLPPTEDWVFDEGATTIIKNKVWTIEYDITVMNGSVLQIEDSIFTIDGKDPNRPAWIYTDEDSTLSLRGTDFIVEDGASGFYIECHDDVTIVDCEFIGLTSNPAGDGAITVYGTKEVTAKYDFVKVHHTNGADALYFENCQVKVANCIINDTMGNGIVMFYGDNEADVWYNVSVIDSEIHNTSNDGIDILPQSHYGNLQINFYYVEIHDIANDALVVYVGDGTSSDRGNGSVYATFDHIEIYNIQGTGLYLSHLYQVKGGRGQNRFQVAVIKSSLDNISLSGIRTKLLYTTVDFSLRVNSSTIKDTGLLTTTDPQAGILHLWGGDTYNCMGTAELYVTKSSLSGCSHSAVLLLDHGGNDFRFVNDSFLNNPRDGIRIITYQQGEVKSGTVVQGCDFSDNDGYALRTVIQEEWAGIFTRPVDVVDCTFNRNGKAAMSLTSSGYDHCLNAGYNVTRCQVKDQDSLAIDITFAYPLGTVVLHVCDSVFDDTWGIRSTISNGSGYQDVLIENTSISNNTGSALLLTTRGATSARVNLTITNSTINYVAGYAVHVVLGRATEQFEPVQVANIDIEGLDVSDIGGVGLYLYSDATKDPPNRVFSVQNSTLHRCEYGLVSDGYNGWVQNLSFQITLKEDVITGYGRVDMFHCSFRSIDEDRLRAARGGEIYLYFELGVWVEWSTGKPAYRAFVSFSDSEGTLITASKFWPPPYNGPILLTLNPFYFRETGMFTLSPYGINASYLKVYTTTLVDLTSDMDVTIVLHDDVPPGISVTIPTEGYLQASPILRVRGTAWDVHSGIERILVSLGGVEWTNASGTIAWDCTLEPDQTFIEEHDGRFVLLARAYDGAGNMMEARVNIIIDTIAPEVEVLFPPDGYITNTGRLEVQGTTDEGSQLEVNGVPVVLSGTNFTAEVVLVEGPNTVSVIAIDPYGNVRIVRHSVHLDTKVPYLVLITPVNGTSTRENSVVVQASLEEGLNVTIQDEEVLYDNERGELYWEVLLKEGRNVVKVEAWDRAGNHLVVTRIVFSDIVAPWLIMVSPQDGQTLDYREVQIDGTVEEGAAVHVNGREIDVDEGWFLFDLLAVEGQNIVELVAVDAAGNRNTMTLSIIVDTIMPYLSITNPTTGEETVNTPRFFIQGTTGYPLGYGSFDLTAVEVLIDGRPYSEIRGEGDVIIKDTITMDHTGRFAIPVDLLEGENVFLVEARDIAGNTVKRLVTIVLDTEAPELSVTIQPSRTEDGVLFTSGSIVNISGLTEPGAMVSINGIHFEVGEDGRFLMRFELGPSSNVTRLTVISTDRAGNSRTFERMLFPEETVTPIPTEGEPGGLSVILVVGVVVLLIALVGTAMYVKLERDRWLNREDRDGQGPV